MDKSSYITNAGIEFVDQQYQQYQQDPATVTPEWQRFFEGFELGLRNIAANGKAGSNGQPSTKTASAAAGAAGALKEINVLNLIGGYRGRGHLFAKVNPILPRKEYKPPLTLETFGLTEGDLDTVFQAGNELGLGPATLRDIIALLEATYCGTIGVEFKYIRIPKVVEWLQQRMESVRNTPAFTPDAKKHILRKLGQATFFEAFLGRRFVGQKRFSLEGAESLIPALDGIIEHGAEQGVEEFVIGMAHRGRLNVLTNIMHKEYDAVFGEFEGKGLSDKTFDGDVKYHMGFSSDTTLASGRQVHLALAPNPSHLEAVNPVMMGMARAKMDNLYAGDHDKICPIQIHGDASLAGQGVVYEVTQMSRLKGYEVGGAIHIVINNQVGFTTDVEDARSSTYCTDVGKVILSPVFHVNGDDPEALAFVTRLAMEFRQEFNRDVFIDIICYRKYGHNEGDEPRFTQPLMYDAIAKHADPFKIYAGKLLQEATVDEPYLKQLETELNEYLNKELQESKAHEAGADLDTTLHRNWAHIRFYDDNVFEPDPNTAVAKDVLENIARQVTHIPEGFNAHKSIVRLMAQRLEMVTTTDQLDWGMGETLAYGSLLTQGYPVRLAGQDVVRGTFSHRHSGIVDQTTQEHYFPLNHLQPEQKPFMAYNSLLSEYAAMGFDFGYASSAPGTLTIWEAQYGDFVNGAQIIIDQFLSSSKTKWQRMCGLVLLLPHGYEGGGPEHSSARMERFLDLCAQNNMYVCDLTTPANLFHALRRQVLTPYRRPLIIFTPKSLLRHPKCVSALKDFTEGSFQEVMDDAAADVKKVKRLVLCTGKIYYDLLEQRDAFKKDDTAIIRMEQLYPFPQEQLDAVLKRYSKAKTFIWTQEEPENMGAWAFMLRKLRAVPLELVSRKESSSPATGTASQHNTQQQYLIKKSLDLAPEAELVKA